MSAPAAIGQRTFSSGVKRNDKESAVADNQATRFVIAISSVSGGGKATPVKKTAELAQQLGAAVKKARKE